MGDKMTAQQDQNTARTANTVVAGDTGDDTGVVEHGDGRNALKAASEAKKYRLRLKDAQEQIKKITADDTKRITSLTRRAETAEKQVETLTQRLQSQQEEADDRFHASQAATVKMLIMAANNVRLDPHGRALPARLQYKNAHGPHVPGVDNQFGKGYNISESSAGADAEARDNRAIDPIALSDALKGFDYGTQLPVRDGTMTVADFYDDDGTFKQGTVDAIYRVIEGIIRQHPYMRAMPAETNAEKAFPRIDGRQFRQPTRHRGHMGELTDRLANHWDY